MRRSFVIIAFLLTAAPAAFAGNDRSAVSRTGLDTNPCTAALPCRSFTSAIAVTNAGGEIVALDSGGYGPFTITTSLTVSGAPGVHAAITASSGSGIVVNAGASDHVILRNLVLIGAGSNVGIEEQAADQLTIAGCLIRGFNSQAINCDLNATALAVDDTEILDNGASSTGISVATAASSHRAIITHCLIQGSNTGVLVQTLSSAIISDSTITGNATGLRVSAAGMLTSAAMTVERCVLAHNTTAAVEADGDILAPSTATLSENVITLNQIGVQFGNFGTVRTFQNNRFYHNFGGDVSGNTMAPIAEQ